MFAFFKHKKFWLPILLIIALLALTEILLKKGFYDQLLKPSSHMGNTNSRLNAINQFGVNSVNWVTLGDSKMDWGVNHEKIRAVQQSKGINHLRLTLAGSNFMSLHSAAEWSIEELPNLDGILLGMYETEFTNPSNPVKEFNISWPFRKYLDHDKFKYFRKEMPITRFINSIALHNYSDDIKDFLKNPWLRLQIKNNTNRQWMELFDFKKDMPGDLCEYDLSDLNGCIMSASKFKSAKDVPITFESPYKNCKSKTALHRQKKQQWQTPKINNTKYYKQWTYMFDSILNANKKLTLVLLPENEFFSYLGKPSNTGELTQKIIDQYRSNPLFTLIDLRAIFDQSNQCQYYYDTLHFNNNGTKIITEKIIEFINSKSPKA